MCLKVVEVLETFCDKNSNLAHKFKMTFFNQNSCYTPVPFTQNNFDLFFLICIFISIFIAKGYNSHLFTFVRFTALAVYKN